MSASIKNPKKRTIRHLNDNVNILTPEKDGAQKLKDLYSKLFYEGLKTGKINKKYLKQFQKMLNYKFPENYFLMNNNDFDKKPHNKVFWRKRNLLQEKEKKKYHSSLAKKMSLKTGDIIVFNASFNDFLIMNNDDMNTGVYQYRNGIFQSLQPINLRKMNLYNKLLE